MRITSLSFQNLNSLKGQWQIDFSHPDFTDDGLFAITGATGAGKTTLLDAICLALYGRTPRLEISQQKNDLISHNTGECYAEISFEINGQHYRAHWSQKRAHSKANGKLQAPKHYLYTHDGKIISEKLSTTKSEIEKRLRMDFTQFTRTVLLAQGHFAAFLQASITERAAILEKITGTEIYTHLSQTVFALCKAEKDRLDQYQQRANSLTLLSPEALTELNQKINENQQEIQKLNDQLKHHRHIHTQHTQQQHWAEQITSIQSQQQQHQIELEHFAPNHQRIATAQQASTIHSAYETWQHRLQDKTELNQSITSLNQRLPEYTQAWQTAQSAWTNAQHHASEKTAQWTQLREHLPIIRAADERVTASQNALQHSSQALIRAQTQQHTLKQHLQERTQDYQALQQQQHELQHFLQTHQQDSQLDKTLPLWHKQAQEAQNIWQNQINTQQQLTQLSEQYETLQAQTAQTQQAQQQVQKHIQQLQAALTEQQTHRQTLPETAQLYQQRDDLKRFIHLKREQQTIIAKQAQTQKKQHQQTIATEQADKQRHELQAKIADIRQRYEWAEQQHLFSQKIMQLSDYRQHLHDGEPCPLCGATEHPFAHEIHHLHDETQQKLLDLKAEWHTAEQAYHTQQQAWAMAQAQSTALSEKLLQLNNELSENQAQLSPLQAVLNVHDDDTASTLLTDCEAQLKHIQEIDLSIQSLQTQWADAERAAHQQRENGQTLQSRTTHITAQLTQTKQTIEQQEQSILTQVADLWAVLGMGAWQHGDIQAALAEIQRVLNELSSRSETYQRTLSRSQELIAPLSTSQTQCDELAQRYQECLQAIESQTLLQQTHSQELADARAKRQQLLNAPNVDDWERTLHQAADSAVKLSEQARQAHHDAEWALRQLENEINLKNNQLNEISVRCDAAYSAFLAQAQQRGFADEQAFLAARLPESLLNQLMVQQKKLAETTQRLAAQQEQAQAEWAKCHDFLQNQLDEMQTQEMITELERRLSKLNECAGSLKAQRDHHESQQNQSIELMAQYAAQEREYQHWLLLNQLIGSKEGYKFRNFAQGLTFDVMIQHANRALQQISDRYLLKRAQQDGENGLEINVIDLWQGGEERTSKNLSGGESFLVSLALALSLSKMHSQNIKIDTLFLDEGFGTLDAETLETALNALSQLKNEGKLIGIISHVPALHERIHTQIQVIPQLNGSSELRGSGVHNTTKRKGNE